MDIRHHRRVRACFCAALLCVALSADLAAATLLRFDFDLPGGGFTLAPADIAPGLSAAWHDDSGLLADFAGASGRALSTSGFTLGNRLHLDIDVAPGWQLVLERLVFALRVSASGPTVWQLALAGLPLASGAAATQFRTFDLALAAVPMPGQLRFDLAGSGATAASGTLRIDDVLLEGSLAPVALPGPLFLIATPLLGLGLKACRGRHRIQSPA